MKKDLQLFSFVLDENSIDDVELFAFKLPNEVCDVIYKMQEGKDKNEASAYRTIYKVASTLFDKVIYCNNSYKDIKYDDYRWVYTLEEFDLNVIKSKITDWLRKEIALRCEKTIEINFKEQWDFEKINLKDILKNKMKKRYSIIPNYYIYKLSQNEYDFECIEKRLKFHRVIGEESAQMMTLPVKLENKLYNPFSYSIEMLMKDPIDIPYSVLNLSISIKVWEDRNIICEESCNVDDSNENVTDHTNASEKPKKCSYLKGDESTSIYLYKENPYYYDKDIIFNKISIGRKNEDSFVFENTCDEQYCDILEIDVLDILKNNNKLQNDSNDIIALIGKKYQAGMLTQYGVGLPERNTMLRLLHNYMPKFELRNPIKYLCKNGNNKEIELHNDELKLYGFEEYVSGEGGKILPKGLYKLHTDEKEISIIIATKSENLRKKLTSAIRILLRLNSKIKDRVFTNEDKLIVEFKYIDNDFAVHLNKDESNIERINKIKDIFNECGNNILRGIIVDIEPYHNLKNYKKLDSKNAVRNGLRRSGIISQFINYVDKEDIKKKNDNKEDKKKATNIDTILSTAKDLISALGLQERDLYNDNLKTNDILLGINKLSTSNNDTRLVISKIDNGKTYYKIYPEKIWIESRKFIFNLDNKIIQKSKMDLSFKNRIGFENWIKDSIAEVLESKRKVYCFVDCVLRGSIWPYIKNDQFVNFDNLDIPNKELLRIIRMNSTDEVPDYFIYDGKDNINKRTGIFKGNNKTYYLVGSKHDGNQEGNYWTKCDNPSNTLKKQALYEINIQGTESEEERDSIAKLTQKLRNMNISYKKESSAPLPLYCISRIGEYIKAELEGK